MKIALVKQDVYQDLYISPPNAKPEEHLFSSIMRVGPIGLFTLHKADLYIIKEDITYEECRVWEGMITSHPKLLRKLKTEYIKNIDPHYAQHLEPGTTDTHDKYSIAVNEINWGTYDIVISINISIPTLIVKKYTHTLWCYMIGEAQIYSNQLYFGYDVCLNQLTRGLIAKQLGVVDFPYTYIGKNCLESIIEKTINRKSLQKGIYAEINTTKERPVNKVPHFEPLTQTTGHQIRWHKQNVKENLIEVYDSKYFVKIGGRQIRGNSVFEAISVGTLVLMSPNDLIQTQVLPKETWIFSIEEAEEKIKHLDQNPFEYNRLLSLQRDLLQHFGVDCPFQSLINLLNEKRKINNNIYPNNIKEKSRLFKKMLNKLIR